MEELKAGTQYKLFHLNGLECISFLRKAKLIYQVSVGTGVYTNKKLSALYDYFSQILLVLTTLSGNEKCTACIWISLWYFLRKFLCSQYFSGLQFSNINPCSSFHNSMFTRKNFFMLLSEESHFKQEYFLLLQGVSGETDKLWL